MSNSFKGPAPFIGVGTGRCGSHTLVNITSACKKVACLHESMQIPWYDAEGDPKIGQLIRRFREHRQEGIISGEVGPNYIQHIISLRQAHPDLKVVCMHRNRDEVVESFLEYGTSMPPLRPVEKYKWADGCLGPERMDAKITDCFPIIDAATRRQSIEFWWEMYEKMAEDVAKPVFHITTKSFNSRSVVESLFDFLEIPLDNRVYIQVETFWSMDEVRDVRHKLKERDRYA